jgi:hypothetical protein
MASGSVGQLIALHYHHPVTCPNVTVLNSRARANGRGFIFVRMHCGWAARCRGRFQATDIQGTPYLGDNVAVGRYSIPAGKTRRVPIRLTRLGRKALKRYRIVDVEPYLQGVRSNGQFLSIGSDPYPSEIVAANR